MRYWWVNRAQTARQEIAGGYLWSPKTESGGARSRFYDNMRAAGLGDVVLSYFGTRVRRVGIVVDFALTAPKPEEFGSIGAYWSSTGWLLPISWSAIPMEVAPKAILGSLAPLLPTSHSPVRAATGDGNQKAYLAEVTRAVAELVLATAKLDLSQFEGIRPTTTAAAFTETLDDLVEDAIARDGSLSDTEREQLTRARRGQGEFRRRVMDVEPACRVTGISRPNLLIASHVKPWRSCGTAAERLDGFNGLMLTPHTPTSSSTGACSASRTTDASSSPRGWRIATRRGSASTRCSDPPRVRSATDTSPISPITVRPSSWPSGPHVGRCGRTSAPSWRCTPP